MMVMMCDDIHHGHHDVMLILNQHQGQVFRALKQLLPEALNKDSLLQVTLLHCEIPTSTMRSDCSQHGQRNMVQPRIFDTPTAMFGR